VSLLFEALVAQALLGAPAAGEPPTPATVPTGAGCPEGMRRVRGTHHEQVQRVCLGVGYENKCLAFLPGLVLLEPRATVIDVCMDTHEWPNRAGDRPAVMMRFVEAERMCADAGKRLCSEAEWELACEGPAHRPWPYGWSRRAGACNSDQPFRPYSEAKLSSADARVREAEVERLWQGEPSGNRASCVSAFGIHDLVGNVEEWVTTSRPEWPYRSGLKGGYWSKPWAGCRGTNERHGPRFRYYEIGFRCCAPVSSAFVDERDERER
jgi:hypothetical protein